MKTFTHNIIDSLRSKKVDYGDVRVVEEVNEVLMIKNGVLEAVTRSSDTGFGVRVLKDSGWGFSSSNSIKPREASAVTATALSIARASARVRGEPIVLSPVQPQKGVYRSTVKINPFQVPISKKIDLLLACDKAMRTDKRIKVSTAFLTSRAINVHFASTDGSAVAQEFTFVGGGLKVYAMDKGEMQIRSYDDYSQAGFEFIEAMKLKRHASRVAEESLVLLKAKPCPSMKTTLVLDSSQMVLQVHESCGHPTELDRVLGTEASYAGTSFMTVDKYNRLQYGSGAVSIVADATVPGGLGTFGWDDEGIPAQRVFLIKEGRFVGYQTSRETAPRIRKSSSGAMRADGWNRIPLIRMTNINIEPGGSTLEGMIAGTKDGIYMTTNKSWSIDDKRLNFQFGCEYARLIKNGKLGAIVKNPTYADITPRFWNSCDAVGNKSEWRLYGVPNCGKGEPGQSAYVGHGTAPARFRDVPVGIAK